jgi:hypothetical protein
VNINAASAATVKADVNAEIAAAMAATARMAANASKDRTPVGASSARRAATGRHANLVQRVSVRTAPRVSAKEATAKELVATWTSSVATSKAARRGNPGSLVKHGSRATTSSPVSRARRNSPEKRANAAGAVATAAVDAIVVRVKARLQNTVMLQLARPRVNCL